MLSLGLPSCFRSRKLVLHAPAEPVCSTSDSMATDGWHSHLNFGGRAIGVLEMAFVSAICRAVADSHYGVSACLRDTVAYKIGVRRCGLRGLNEAEEPATVLPVASRRGRGRHLSAWHVLRDWASAPGSSTHGTGSGAIRLHKGVSSSSQRPAFSVLRARCPRLLDAFFAR